MHVLSVSHNIRIYKMNSKMNYINKNRIYWIDIYKAIAIILVVIGHATGMFNKYIYLFHVSAFFFISGYVAKNNNEKFDVLVLKKLYTLILPLLVCLLINAEVMFLLSARGTYEYWFGDFEYIGYGNIVKNFIWEGSIWTWLLGPCWFLVVLFLVSVCSKITWDMSNSNTIIFLLYSVFIYAWGYICIHNNYLVDVSYSLRKVMIAQFFYSLGYVIKKNFGERINNTGLVISIILFLISLSLLIAIGNISNMKVDYADEEFGNIIYNTLNGFVGIICIFAVSNIIARLNKKVSKFFCFIGQNTMGVLLFHFIFFKFIYWILALLSVIPSEEIQNITPSENIGNKYWLLITVGSICGSILVWTGIKRIPHVNTLFGLNKEVFKPKEEDLRVFRKRSSVVLITACYLLSLRCYADHIYVMMQPVNIEFPNEISNDIVEFDGGWQPQDENDYRWIEDKGIIKVNSYRHDSLMIQGYVPEDFEEVSKLDIYVDDQLIGSVDTNDGMFEVNYDIKGKVKDNQYTIMLDFDGVHEPEQGSADFRKLSGIIGKIYIK